MAKPACRGKAGEDITNFSRAQVTDATDPVDAVIRALRLRPLVAERRAKAMRTFSGTEVTDVIDPGVSLPRIAIVARCRGKPGNGAANFSTG